jgi:hypothetical protein
VQVVPGCAHGAIPARVRGYCACVRDVIEHADHSLLGSLVAQRGKCNVTKAQRVKCNVTVA